MIKIISVLALVFITACGSPINHKVKADQSTQKNKESLKLVVLNLNLEVSWLIGPFGNIKKDNQLMVIVKDQDGNLVRIPKGLTLNFYSMMLSMGHPMEDAGFFQELDDGVYINKTIRFNMPGDWHSEIRLMDSEFNIKDKVVWDEFF